ncbi:hypothetical protein HJG60_008176 [Phyllostomus discolor]|uniref:Uncharacterized protein n=1 Tax=Phyllostomus discolor TaxID=89673 RepID=A0A834DQE3_9CHIR|nr:hypothetical protein HJG60_008176 [Phyllostomus discolor]
MTSPPKKGRKGNSGQGSSMGSGQEARKTPGGGGRGSMGGGRRSWKPGEAPRSGRQTPCRQCQLCPMGPRELGGMRLAWCWRRSLWGWGAASLPLIRHCENTPFSVYSSISQLFVCLLIILLLEQNTQCIRRFCFCERLGVSALPRSGVTKPEPTGGDMKGDHRNRSPRHGLGSCLEVQGRQT